VREAGSRNGTYVTKTENANRPAHVNAFILYLERTIEARAIAEKTGTSSSQGQRLRALNVISFSNLRFALGWDGQNCNRL